MEDPHRNPYAVLREEHTRNKDALDRHINETANRDNAPTPEATATDWPVDPAGRHPNYAILREEHARAINALDRHLDDPENREVKDAGRGLASEQEVDQPSRPHDVPRSPGWTERGGMVAQQTSAMDWVKASHQRKLTAEAEREQDVEEKRSEQESEVAPDQTPKRDDGIER